MCLKHSTNGKLIEVLSQTDLFNPMHRAIVGRYHAGEDYRIPRALKNPNSSSSRTSPCRAAGPMCIIAMRRSIIITRSRLHEPRPLRRGLSLCSEHPLTS